MDDRHAKQNSRTVLRWNKWFSTRTRKAERSCLSAVQFSLVSFS